MPYASKKQAAYIHMLAERGKPWAKKFVADSKGTKVKATLAYSPPRQPEQLAPSGGVNGLAEDYIAEREKRRKRRRRREKEGPVSKNHGGHGVGISEEPDNWHPA